MEQAPEKTIRDYKAAFRAVNDVPCPHITYSHGWFTFQKRAVDKVRESTLLEWTERLRTRAGVGNAG